MTQPLFPHQKAAAIRIANGLPTYLGFDMGIGKTRTFIEAAMLKGVKRILVICPASAVLVWRREIRRWHPEAVFATVKKASDLVMQPQGGKPSYLIVSHGLMSQRDGDVASNLHRCQPFELTAIDEAQAFNAKDSIRVKRLQTCRANFGQMVPLSGTPFKNHYGELYTLLAACWPEGLQTKRGFMSRAQFEEKFCIVADRYFGGSRPIRVIEGSKNGALLKELIAPYMVRVRKMDVFTDLPPINWDTIPIPIDSKYLSSEDLRQFEARLAGTLVATDVDIDATAKALSAVALRDTAIATLRRQLGLAKLRGATEYIVDTLDQLPDDRKVLVFAHHADVIRALTHHFAEYSPAVLTGETSAKDRETAVDKFLNDPRCRVFVGNIQAAGTAITLVGPKCKCSDVIFVESSWTPMDNAQAACRVHRIGQHDAVVAKMLSAAGTIDELINAILARKARDFTTLFDTQGEKT